jgi:hypothetical protein
MRNSIGYAERDHIHDRLKEVCRKPPGEEFAVYDPGYDDDVVAAEMTDRLGRTILPSNVAFVRKKKFGLLRPARVLMLVPNVPADRQIFDLQRQVASLTTELNELRMRIILLEGISPRKGSL